MSNFHLKVSGVAEVLSNGNIAFLRYLANLMEILAEKGNFTYSIVWPPIKEFYGQVFPNGSWNGLIGMIQREEADVIFGLMIMTPDRTKVLEFSRPLTTTTMAILTGQKRVTSSVQDVFANLSKSSSEVWLVITVIGLIVSLICASAEINTETMSTSRIVKRFLLSTLNHLFFLFGIFTQKGSNSKPKSPVAKLALFHFLFSAMMLAIYFGCGFSTDLVVMPKLKFVDDREQLVKSKQVKPATYGGSALETLLRSSRSGVYGDIWKRIECGDGFLFSMNNKSFSDSLLASGEIGFIQADIFLVAMGHDICKAFPNTVVHISKETFYSNPIGIGYRKSLNRDIKEILNKLISWLDQSGIWNVWMREHTVRDIGCFSGSIRTSDSQGQGSFQVDSMRLTLIVTSFGFAVATVVLFIEVCWVKLFSKFYATPMNV